MMEKISKEFAAIVQLQDALELFYKGHYISAIALAGAADEILGRLASEVYSVKVGANIRQDYAEMLADCLVRFPPNNLGQLTTKEEKEISSDKMEIIKKWNETRNQIKHKSFKEENEIESESFKDDALHHIGCAIINYKLYKGKMPDNPVLLKHCEDRGLS